MSGATLQDERRETAAAGKATSDRSRAGADSVIRVSVFTAGRDRPYALGLASALMGQGIQVDFIGSDGVDSPELHGTPLASFLNLRGDQRKGAGAWEKVTRVLAYYGRLITYAAKARPDIFHILWNNKFEWFDRTLLMLYYRMLGRKLVFTAHNVNAGKRDGNDSRLNRFSLRVQYRLSHHIFVHTERMKDELISEFGVAPRRVSVIPFGINSTVPNTSLTAAEARAQLGITSGDKAMLFFGNIAPYKGLQDLVTAMGELLKRDGSYRLIVAGRTKAGEEDYWEQVRRAMTHRGVRHRVIEKIEYVPDEQTELYFKAADVLMLPYTHVFQSGVLFLGYNFGLPVIATDVGSLKDEIIEGKTGLVCRAKDPSDLARSIEAYFSSAMYRELEGRRQGIRDYAAERYSWTPAGKITRGVYEELLSRGRRGTAAASGAAPTVCHDGSTRQAAHDGN